MAGLVLIQGLGLVLGATSAPAGEMPTMTQVAAIQVDGAAVGTPVAQPYAAKGQRTRDERLGTMALRGYPRSERWVPPAQSWGRSGDGPVVEIGALGAPHAWQPDLAHLSLQWQF